MRWLVVALAAGLAVLGFVAFELPAGEHADELELARVTPTATPAQSTPAAADATATPDRKGVDVARLMIPSLEIDAPIITLGVDADGAMQTPDNPTDVAWYDFSGRPGEGSNIVMAGHLDYVNYGPAVFYRLKEAQAGDEVRLALVDGTVAPYRVIDVTFYDEATAPVEEIVGPTEREIVTLITCAGSFDRNAREYDKRVVLRAERVPDLARGRP
jgi:LPXTG-site transpeptidase (sortase) family protein